MRRVPRSRIHPSRLESPLAGLGLLLALGVACLPLSAQERKRTFRPIVPIKQNVLGGEGASVAKSLSVAIPPPPIPAADAPPERPAKPAPASGAPVEETSSPDEQNSRSEAPPEAADTPPSGAPPESAPDADSPPADPSVKKAVPGGKGEGPTLAQLREEAHRLADTGLTYRFGASNPDSGGLDCSGTIQYLLTKLGVEGVPRTSYDQYYWLRRLKLLDDVHGRNAEARMMKKLSPGDLIFWGGTWKSGHSVSHVMLYLGYDPHADKHYIFGARGRNATGMLGNGVDIFELGQQSGRLIAHGKIPGLRY